MQSGNRYYAVGLWVLWLFCLHTELYAEVTDLSSVNVLGGHQQVISHPVTSSILVEDIDVTSSRRMLLSDQSVRTYSTAYPTFGFSHGTAQVRINIQNDANDHNTHFVVYLDYPLLDHVRFYEVDDGSAYLRYETGDAVNFNRRPVYHRAFVFPVTIPVGEQRVFLIEASSIDTLQLPIRLFRADAFEHHLILENYLLGIYFGGVFMMAIFVSFLYVTLRDRTLVYMSLFLIMLIGVSGSINGLIFQFVSPGFPTLTKELRILWISVGMVAVVCFACEYLKTQHYLPKVYRYMRYIAVSCACLPILNLFVPFFYSIQFVLLFGIIITLTISYSGIAMLRFHYPPTIYYLFGWLFFFLGGIATVLRAFAILPSNLWTEYGFQFGSLFSTATLALGLASKFDLERKQREDIEYVAIIEKENRLKAQLQAQEETYKKENAEREARAKGEFLANMSHEIRTPMNGVLGLAHLLSETALDSEQEKLVRTIESSGKTLLGILNDILDYSKIESGKFEVEKIPVEPREIIATTIELFASHAEDRGVFIRHEISSAAPTTIASDPTRLSQVLFNLTSNAFKFTHNGEIVIRAGGKGDVVRFEVQDSGIGLTEDQSKKLFTSFSQADQSTTRKYGGTGLGLYISKQLVELMGGEIGVSSRVGQGATFWFTIAVNRELLPCESLLDERPYKQGKIAGQHDVSPIDLSSLRILIAEDNSVNQMVIQGLLRKLNISGDITENGAQCVTALLDAGFAYDCILMDCEMPEMDGYEATKRIRELLNDGRSLPIIGLSANALPEHESRARAAGMDYYLRKPVNFDDLRSVLTQVVSKVPY